MPELPEVETIRRQLQKSLKNRVVKDVFVRMDKMVKVGSGKISTIKKGSKEQSAEFVKLLKSKTVKDVVRRAKFLIIKLSGRNFLFVHLRMSGQLILVSKWSGQKQWPAKHTHVEIDFKDGPKLFYNDHRQFGHMRIANEKEAEEVLAREALGPEPLDMSLNQFCELIKSHPQKRAKDFLLNQKVIAGIGNIYADESLFEARINPGRKIFSLKVVEVENLYTAIQKILKRAIKLKGSSFRTYLNINGRSGKFVSEHKVYGRSGKPCLNCGMALIHKQIAGRTTVFCPACQK